MDPRPLVVTHDLSKRFRDRTAVDGLNFTIERNEVVGLLGPNGAGKTTALRMLAGIIGPTSGTATVNGVDPAREPEKVHESIGFLTETPGFYERLSAERNLAYFAGFYEGIDPKSAARRELARMDLASRASDPVGTFSKGMKQRLALARVLLHAPRVLFLDEPTAGLDPEAARDLRELIISLRKDGAAILLSTHNLTEAEGLCDRIAVIRTRLVAVDTPRALRERQFERRLRIRLAGGAEECLAALRSEAFVRDVRKEGDDLLSVLLVDPDRDRPRLVARIVSSGGQILEVREDERSLEAAYLNLVEEP